MKAAAAAAFAGMLAACSGGGHSGVLPNAAPTSKPVAPANATTTMVVKIPAHTASSAGRKPAYISASTQSLGFSYTTDSGAFGLQQNFNVTPGSPGCTTDANANTTCTLTFGVSAGNVSYTIFAYDGTNGTGKLLSTATGTMTAVTGQDNRFSIVLDGVPAKYTLTAGKTSVPAGTPVDVPLTISAYDADGNLIVNSPQLSIGGTPTIASNDSNEFQMTQNGQTLWAYQGNADISVLTQPLTGVVVHYNGGIRKNDTLTFSDGSITASAAINVTAPTSTASLVFGQWFYPGLYLGGEDSSGVDGLPGGGSTTLLPVTQMGWNGNWTGTCQSGGAEGYGELTTDANNEVAFLATSGCSGGGLPAEPAIVAQAPGAASPAWTITALGQDFTVSSFAFDSANAPYLWLDLGNQTVGGVTADHAEIVVLRPGSNGQYSASMVARSIDYVDNPEAIAVAPDGTIYAAHVGDVGGHVNSEAIDVFAPGANGDANTNAPPVRYIGGALTGLAKIKQLALDSKGNLYVANAGNGVNNSSITVYAPGAAGNVSPIRTIEGANTQLDSTSNSNGVGGLAIDGFDNLYALGGGGQFLVFPPGADGNVAPSRVFGERNGLNGPIAVVK